MSNEARCEHDRTGPHEVFRNIASTVNCRYTCPGPAPQPTCKRCGAPLTESFDPDDGTVTLRCDNPAKPAAESVRDMRKRHGFPERTAEQQSQSIEDATGFPPMQQAQTRKASGFCSAHQYPNEGERDYDPSCRICWKPEDALADECRFSKLSSRVCERGMKCCTTYHRPAALRAVSQPTREQITGAIRNATLDWANSDDVRCRDDQERLLQRQADAVLALYGKSEAKPVLEMMR